MKAARRVSLAWQRRHGGDDPCKLDANLSHYAGADQKSLRIDVNRVPAGAAGGMGAALMAFLGAELKSGIEIVTQALNLEEHIQ